MPQKYFSESMLGLCSNGVLMLRPVDIEPNYKDNLAQAQWGQDCHIYMISKRPKISLKPDSLEMDNAFAYGIIDFHIKGRRRREPFRLTKQMFQPYVKTIVASDYPHTDILAFSESGELVHSLPVNLIAHNFDFQNNVRDHLDLEILYIGQAYGSKGSRHAIDRLRSHSTLQKIQAETFTNDPDADIFLLLVRYADPILHTLFNPLHPQITGTEDEEHYTAIHRRGYKEAHLVTLAEAGLIRYFRPVYNLMYAKNFPSTNLTSLEECYELDILALAVEIDTETLGLNIYSEQVERHFHHTMVYSLHPLEERTNHFLLDGAPSLFD